MIKTLVKKQLMETWQGYFVNKKTGKARSKAGTVGFFAIYAILLLYLCVFFYFLASGLYVLADMGYPDAYFTIMITIAVAFGVFGSVFNTYAGIYHAKDNELLLSMPISPAKILVSRMVSVYLLGLMYTSVVLLPTILLYNLANGIELLALIYSIVMLFVINFFVLVLTLVFGYFVAIISSKLKNKSVITAVIAAVFIVVYYYAIGSMQNLPTLIMQNAEKVASFSDTWLVLLNQAGKACTGKTVPMLVFTVISAALFAVAMKIMSDSFIKIATKKDSIASNEFSIERIKSTSVSKALLKKEFMRFKSNATYLLNCGLGVVLFPCVGVYLLVKSERLREIFAEVRVNSPEIFPIIPIVCFAVPFFAMALDGVTAPSVSLEGKNIWIAQTLPVDSALILRAKQQMHLIMNIPVSIFFSLCLSYAVGLSAEEMIYSAVFSILAVMFFAAFGLMLNLKMPNLSWTNETVPIKQSMPAFLSIFGSWGIGALIIGAFLLIKKFIYAELSSEMFMVACIVIFALCVRFMNNWIYTKGAKIFSTLQ